MNRLVRLSLFTNKSAMTGTSVINPQVAVVARKYASNLAKDDSVEMEHSMNKIEELFATAKDELEYAEESQGTTYYHEDLTTAEKAVNETLTAYDSFLKELPSDDMRNEVKTKVGMKMRELKMAFDALPEEGH